MEAVKGLRYRAV